MKVRDVLGKTSADYCMPETRLNTAVKTMKKSNKGSLPVLDENKRVIGTVKYADARTSNKISSGKVNEIMSPDVHALNIGDEVFDALLNMRSHREAWMPVVNQEGQLEGSVSVHNLMAGLLHAAEPEAD